MIAFLASVKPLMNSVKYLNVVLMLLLLHLLNYNSPNLIAVDIGFMYWIKLPSVIE